MNDQPTAYLLRLGGSFHFLLLVFGATLLLTHCTADSDPEAIDQVQRADEVATSSRSQDGAGSDCDRYDAVVAAFCVEDDLGSPEISSIQTTSDGTIGPGGGFDCDEPNTARRYLNAIGWPEAEPYRSIVLGAMDDAGYQCVACLDPIEVYTRIYQEATNGTYIGLTEAVVESYLTDVLGATLADASSYMQISDWSSGGEALLLSVSESTDRCIKFSATRATFYNVINHSSEFTK